MTRRPSPTPTTSGSPRARTSDSSRARSNRSATSSATCARTGGVIDVEVSRSRRPRRDGKILYFVFSERDITEERALAAQLSHQALHDPLTGLANRALFEDRLAQAHGSVMRQGGIGAVLLIDLDDFKGVNDTYGHFVGDQLLTAIAQPTRDGHPHGGHVVPIRRRRVPLPGRGSRRRRGRPR